MKKVLLCCILMFIIIGIVFLNAIRLSNIEKDNLYTKNEIMISDLNISGEDLINILTTKNGNWDELPLTKNFRKKFNAKDGILGKMDYDSVKKNPYNNGEYPFEDYSYIVVKKGKKETAYMYNFILDKEMEHYEDFKIKRIYNLTDENGNKLDAKSLIDKDNYQESFRMLCAGYMREQCIGVTDSFHKKYPYFLDIFVHYSPLKFNHIEFVEENSSWERKEAYFVVDSILECKKREYLVEFALDKRGYLDDVDVKLIKEEMYEGNSQERINKVTYKNSNWNNLKLTDSFRKKFEPNNGVMDDIDSINIDIDVDEVTLEMNKKYITCFVDKNDTIVSYYFEYLKDNEGYLDDVICEKLPYINKTAIEVKELYLKENKE